MVTSLGQDGNYALKIKLSAVVVIIYFHIDPNNIYICFTT